MQVGGGLLGERSRRLSAGYCIRIITYHASARNQKPVAVFIKCEFEYAAVCWVLEGFGVGWGKEGGGKGG